MLRKLMKYDLLWINKIMIYYFIIALTLSILTRCTSYLTDSFMGNIIHLVLRGCVISSFASCLITCAIRIWVKFRISIYKDEAYLIHTLPVEKNTLYNAKVSASIVSLFISLMVIIVCLVISFLDKELLEQIKILFQNKNMIIIVISLIITVFLEMIYLISSGIMGILIGHKGNNHRMVKSILIGICLYFFLQIILLIIIWSIGLLNNDVRLLFSTNISVDIISSLKLLTIIANNIYIVFIVGMYFIGKKIFKKGINVE